MEEDNASPAVAQAPQNVISSPKEPSTVDISDENNVVASSVESDVKPVVGANSNGSHSMDVDAGQDGDAISSAETKVESDQNDSASAVTDNNEGTENIPPPEQDSNTGTLDGVPVEDGASLSQDNLQKIAVAKDSGEAPSKKARIDLQSLPTRQYLDQTVVPILLQALAALSKERPSEPIEYLAAYLLKHKVKYES